MTVDEFIVEDGQECPNCHRPTLATFQVIEDHNTVIGYRDECSLCGFEGVWAVRQPGRGEGDETRRSS